MIRKFLIALCASLLALVGLGHFAADAKRKADTPPARPALWVLSDQDTTIYLFGTIHLLPKGLAWRSPKLEAAMAKSDTLVLEVAGLEDREHTAAIMLKAAITPGLPPLVERVPADKRAKLETLANDAGVPLSALNAFEDWAAAITLAVGSLKDLGLDPNEGAEEQLRRTFAARGKPVQGLETAEQQFGYFDHLSPAAQQTLLISTIDESSNAKTEFDRMLGAWKAGDEKKMALSFDDELKLSPELFEVLLKKRNANWAQWIDDRMDKPGTLFIGVGAGHLAGPDSVQRMLKKRGFKVKRVQ
ncbi:MAG TPA: TraB/GumN family protein [Chakrabartia sp.]|nr:TraB/GumN family protein [Chakrabartia sp.]